MHADSIQGKAAGSPLKMMSLALRRGCCSCSTEFWVTAKMYRTSHAQVQTRA